MNKNLIASAIVGLGLTTSGFVHATPIANQFFPGALNQLSDNNAEYLLNANGSLSDAGDSTLDANDRLVGMFTIETIENLSSGGTNNIFGSGRELTGVFDVTVTSKIPTITGFNYTFGATAANGIAVRVFDDATQNYTRLDGGVGVRAARLAALLGNASDGLSFLDLGIDQYWFSAVTTDDIAVIGALPPGQAVNSFLVSLNILNNNSGLTFNKVNCGVTPGGLLGFHQADICGSGSLLGVGGAVTPFDSFSNIDFTANVVPEPGMLALLGLGLVGMGVSLRKRKAA